MKLVQGIIGGGVLILVAGVIFWIMYVFVFSGPFVGESNGDIKGWSMYTKYKKALEDYKDKADVLSELKKINCMNKDVTEPNLFGLFFEQAKKDQAKAHELATKDLAEDKKKMKILREIVCHAFLLKEGKINLKPYEAVWQENDEKLKALKVEEIKAQKKDIMIAQCEELEQVLGTDGFAANLRAEVEKVTLAAKKAEAKAEAKTEAKTEEKAEEKVEAKAEEKTAAVAPNPQATSA